MSPSGEKFAQLCCALASHILSRMPNNSSVLAPPSVTHNKTPLSTQFKLQILKGNLLSEFETWIKLTQSFQDQYREYKEVSR